MKTRKNFTVVALIAMLALISAGVQAQGKGHGHHGHKVDRHPHHHHAKVIERGHVHTVSPRYVYYRDFNIYYDYSRRAYLTLSSGRWVVSTSIPVAMRRHDMARTTYIEVDYRGDDIGYYHNHYQPVVCKR